MKSLLILRHAKSSWKFANLTDHERPLNKRGRQDAPRMGRLIRREGLLPDMILTSTAVRAITTATLVAAACGYGREPRSVPSFYLADSRDYLETLLRLDDDCQRVLIVGHNPGIEQLVQITGGADETMPTAALAHVRLPIERWVELSAHLPGQLVEVWRPKEID